MLYNTLRVKIGTKLFNRLVHVVENGEQWFHEWNLWDIVEIKRIERTDFIHVVLGRPDE